MSIGTMRSEVIGTFTEILQKRGVALGDPGKTAAGDVYDATLGKFDKRNKRNGVDVWKSRNFKTFVLRETKKIAAAAAKSVSGGTLSGTELMKAARAVMLATNKKCKARVVAGEIVGFPYPAGEQAKPGQGDVCTGFLDANT